MGRRDVKRARAFTLIEVLILIVVGLILAAAAIPSFVSLDDQKVTAAANVLEADLEYVRARSIGTALSHRLSFDAAAESYSVECPPGTLLNNPLTRKQWKRPLTDSGVEIVSATFGTGTKVTFDGAGRPSVGGRVILKKGTFQIWVDIADVTGDVTITPKW